MKILIALCISACVAVSLALPVEKTQPQQAETLESVDLPVYADNAEFRRVRSPAQYGVGYGGYPGYGGGYGGYQGYGGYPGYGGGIGGGYYPGYGGGFGSAGASASASASAGGFGK